MVEHKDSFRQACKDFEEDLVLYYYGESREPEAHRVEEHLKECASCERFLEELRAYLPLTGEPQDPPQAFWNSYYRELKEKLAAQDERAPWWRRLFVLSHPWSVPALGTAVALIFALTLTFGKGIGRFKISSIQDEVPPEIRAAADNIDFFETMDLLESIELLEALEQTRSAPTAVHNL